MSDGRPWPRHEDLDGDFGGRYSYPGHRRLWWVLVVAIVACVVVASSYVLLSQKSTPVIPVAWSLPARCYQYCQFASDGTSLYVLVDLNSPEGMIADLASYFTLQAYDWSSGKLLWSVANFTVWGVWASTPVFVFGGTVAVVASGDGEWVPGQSGPPEWFGPQSSTFVFEWNASTGDFLNQSHYGTYYGGIAAWSATEAQGWIAVAAGAYASPNLSVQSIPMPVHSARYGKWVVNVNPGTLPSNFCGPVLHVFLAAGTLSIWATGGASLATVLNGSTGVTLWQGIVAGWSSVESEYSGCLPMNVVSSASGLYYVGGNGMNAAIDLFDPANQLTSTVVNLSGTNVSGDGLNLEPGGEFVVTDTFHDTYSAFSFSGVPLWSRGLNISVVSSTGLGQVFASTVRPISLGPDSLFLFLEFSEGGMSGNGSIEYNLPLEAVNATTGSLLWQSAYTNTMCSGSCGGAGSEIYWPVIGAGSYLVVTVYHDGNWSCVVAKLPGVA